MNEQEIQLPNSDRGFALSTHRVDVPASARVWNYWGRGKDAYEVDQIMADAGMAIYPDIATIVREARQFLSRTVQFLTESAGVQQFLDIGAGLPMETNTHQMAQRVIPEAKTVYVDHDPMVMAYARALLTCGFHEETVGYVECDLLEPETIVAEASGFLDFTKPVAVLCLNVLGHVRNDVEARKAVEFLMNSVAAGSYLTICDGTTTNSAYRRVWEINTLLGGLLYRPRSVDEINAFFHGLDMITPGLVPVTHWRPENTTTRVSRLLPCWGATARKP